MTEEVMPGLFRMEIPLPNSPLKAVNSYVIRHPDRNLIIDTGMNREECMSAFKAGLQELDIDLGKTDFFITHMHADHAGLVSALASETARVYCSLPDSGMISPDFRRADDWLKVMAGFAMACGFPESVLHDAMARHPGFRYISRGPLQFSIVKEGDTVAAGDYSFRCVETPGHTPGHICLYDSGKKLLVSGDHILDDITPNISLWSDDRNPLREYLESLDKVSGLEVDLVLPGHRSLIRNCRGRIQELKGHHDKRAREVLDIIGDGGLDAYQVASRMSWDMTYESWDLFPSPQKWFATGEAVSHLKYLEGEKLISRNTGSGKIVFSRVTH